MRENQRTSGNACNGWLVEGLPLSLNLVLPTSPAPATSLQPSCCQPPVAWRGLIRTHKNSQPLHPQSLPPAHVAHVQRLGRDSCKAFRLSLSSLLIPHLASPALCPTTNIKSPRKRKGSLAYRSAQERLLEGKVLPSTASCSIPGALHFISFSVMRKETLLGKHPRR